MCKKYLLADICPIFDRRPQALDLTQYKFHYLQKDMSTYFTTPEMSGVISTYKICYKNKWTCLIYDTLQ
jgi:hypothetical protein